MSKSKKIFLAFAIVFLALLLYASYDISSRTTFPGSKHQLPARIKEQFGKPDSTKVDSLSNRPR